MAMIKPSESYINPKFSNASLHLYNSAMQILKDVTCKQVIQRSEFITLLKRCFTVEQAKEIVSQSMIDYPNATHYCYAYLLNNHQISKSNDNGEPSGTAGSPILQALLKNDLDNVICIVIRYFGGIKLGAGGLIRAYSSSALQAIEQAQFTHFITWHQFSLTVEYDSIGIVNHLCDDQFVIQDTQFNSDVTYTITTIKDNYVELLDNALKNNYLLEVLDDILIETTIDQ